MLVNITSPCVLGIIVAFAIFSSIRSKIPVLSSDALIKVPELEKLTRYCKSHATICSFLSKILTHEVQSSIITYFLEANHK